LFNHWLHHLVIPILFLTLLICDENSNLHQNVDVLKLSFNGIFIEFSLATVVSLSLSSPPEIPTRLHFGGKSSCSLCQAFFPELLSSDDMLRIVSFGKVQPFVDPV
jgi:hypothetical protein